MSTMDHLISLYKKRLHLQEACFAHIDHDDALVATVFKVTLPDGMQLILKVCPRIGDYLREAYFLDQLAKKLPVPRIIQRVPPEEGLHGAILMEYFAGELLKITDLNDPLMYEIGSLLGRIHLNRVKDYGDLTQPDQLSPDPRIPFIKKFNEGLEECKDHLPKHLIEKCLQYLEGHLDLMTTVDGPCIIHRDFRPGNLIIHHGVLQGIIDWSSGRGGCAEEDFSSLQLGEWFDKEAYKTAFLAGYTSMRKVPDYHSILPLLRLNRAIGAIGFTVKQGIWKSKGAKIYQFNLKFIEDLARNS